MSAPSAAPAASAIDLLDQSLEAVWATQPETVADAEDYTLWGRLALRVLVCGAAPRPLSL